MKKLLAFILTLSIAISCVSMATFTASAETYGDLTYTISDGEVTITDCDTWVSTLEIPEKIEGYPVTSIGDRAFYMCSSLTSITIPDSVTSIGESAFDECYDLTSIIIPDSVTSIDNFAFYMCTKLTNITIPDSVTYIGNGALEWCGSLKSLTLPDSITSISEWTFAFCEELTSITLPNSVTTIGSNAFWGCSNLQTVYYTGTEEQWDKISKDDSNEYLTNANIVYNYIPTPTPVVTPTPAPTPVPSLQYLTYEISNGEVTITGCDSSVSGILEIPETIEGYPVTSIAIWGLAFLRNITEVKLPKTLLKIGSGAFEGCNNLSKVVIEQGTTEIVSAAFRDCGSLTEITIPDSVTSIGDYAFYGCDSLASITIPHNVSNIGRDAFYNTAYYNDISNWENDVLYINNHLIKSKKSISGAYTIKEGTITIASEAFSYCNNLTDIIIADTITNIGSYAFRDCEGLTNLIIPDYVKRIEDGAFCGCNKIKTLYIGKNVSYIANSDNYKGIQINTFEGCTEIENIFIDENNEYYYSENNCIIEKNTQELIFAGKESAIPNGVKIIGAHTFRDRDFTEIYIPDSVTIIEPYAFYNCKNLKTISFSKNLKDIGDSAFCYCESILQLTLPQNLEYIGYEVFAGCSSLTSITIPDSVTSIVDSAFYNCSSLTSIIIPDSVTSIDYGAFYGCSSLNIVYYTGTEEQWNNISIDGGNEDLTNANIVYNYGVQTPTPEPKIESAQPNIGADLTLNLQSNTQGQMKINHEGKEITVDGILDEKTGKYIYVYEGITPQCLGDKIDMALWVDGEVVDSKEDYSIVDYCNNIYKAGKPAGYSDEKYNALLNLLADMLDFGAASQKYMNYKTGSLMNTGDLVKNHKTAFNEEDFTTVKKLETKKADSEYKFKSVGLHVDSYVSVYVKFNQTLGDNVSVKVNFAGENYTYTKANLKNGVLYLEDLKSTQYDEVHTIELVVDGETVQTLTYSANSYVKSNCNGKNSQIVQAIGRYGASAVKLVNTK